MVEIPELDGLTQARKLREAELTAREYIAVTLDAPLDDVAVTIEVTHVDGIDVAGALAKIEAERAEAARLAAQADADTLALARALQVEKVPVRDIGVVLDVTGGRVSQLLKPAS
jgi:hypothetical protein